jgi:hypothetical protein
MTTQKTIGLVVGLVVYAFGTPHSNKSNQALAGYVLSLVRQRPEIRFRIYTQNDIQFWHTEYHEYQLDVTYFPQLDDEEAPPTLRIARGAAQWAQHQVDEVFVVAATPHRRRALRDTQAAFKEAAIEIPIYCPKHDHPDFTSFCVSFDDYADHVRAANSDRNYWFDPDGTQFRAASRRYWNWREFWIRRAPYWLYRIVAK